jgi:hypothetical protein
MIKAISLLSKNSQFSEGNRTLYNQLNHHMVSATLKEWITYKEDKKVGAICFIKELGKIKCGEGFLREFGLAFMAI